MRDAAAWSVTADDFPANAPLRERLRYFLRFAVLAPSTHNTQPWRFRVLPQGIDVYADPLRTLAVIDRTRRQQLISVGAAIYNLRLAMVRFGLDPELVARITVGGVARPNELDQAMFGAIVRRRTNRQPFTQRPVSYRIMDELVRVARDEGAELVRLGPRAKPALAEVITLADRAQFADREFRRELTRWLVASSSRRLDGIPFVKKEYGSSLPVGPLMVRTFDIGNRVAAKERELATGSPALVVLSTPADTTLDWVAAGQAMQAVLLRGNTYGLSASFLNQPLEVDALRPRVAELAHTHAFPQLVLRLGFGPPVVRPTPRRLLDDVLID
jgi:hypothetical protein